MNEPISTQRLIEELRLVQNGCTIPLDLMVYLPRNAADRLEQLEKRITFALSDEGAEKAARARYAERENWDTESQDSYREQFESMKAAIRAALGGGE